MSLGLQLPSAHVEVGQLRTEDRLDALAVALSQCSSAGEVMTLEADWVTAKWRLRHPVYVYTAARMCEARRSELSALARQASGGASAGFWEWE